MTPTELTAFWDAVVAHFLAGGRPEDDGDLQRWFSSYGGRARGRVEPDALPEPWIGPLGSRHEPARLVTLGLNPGAADLEFQGREGVFANAIRPSSFSEWAGASPYSSSAWTAAKGVNRYQRARARFAATLLDDPALEPKHLLLMELYPWHSRAVTAAMAPPHDLLDRYVWSPLAELDVPLLFAFGKPWMRVVDDLNLAPERVDLRFHVASRHGRLFRLRSGQVLCVIWQRGYSGPPGESDTLLLRDQVARYSEA